MPNPWDPLPLPLIGDADDAALFEALGRTLERWEQVELGLSFMYSLFTAGDVTFAKMREYGAGRIFRDRLAALRKAAEFWFVKNPDQTKEARFLAIAKAAEGFAERRNEFAHGLVTDGRRFIFWRLQMALASPNSAQFLVIPPLHSLKKNDASGTPSFGYSSAELNIIRDRFEDLEAAIHHFKHDLWPIAWPDESSEEIALPYP